MAKMLKDTLKTIESYKTQSPHYEELLAILEEILILREEYRRKMPESIFPVDERLISSKMEGGLPLIDLSQGDYDLTQPQAYFLDLLQIAEKRAPGETKELAGKIKSGEEDFKEMLLSAFYGEQEDEEGERGEEDETFDLIDLFLEECLRPSFEKVVSGYGDVVLKSKWSEGYCPVCGKEPKIGKIKEEEGTRFLFCNQCGIEWPFLRIKCPFCGNEEQQTLAYFTVEDDERYRVDVCNECKRYIKIVDFRETKEEPNLDIEDITTLHLDILATEEGYD
ncbi:MAG: formate dehydrogenase accessory protein FdhE [Syntrophales bacterium]|nr:formate dehydrogenase accessory protein FdhE [Syntrophales bacterium]